MNAMQTFMNIAPTALGLQIMPPQGVATSFAAYYTKFHPIMSIGNINNSTTPNS